MSLEKAILIDFYPEITEKQSKTLHKFLYNNPSYKWGGKMGRYSDGTKTFTLNFEDEPNIQLTINANGVINE